MYSKRKKRHLKCGVLRKSHWNELEQKEFGNFLGLRRRVAFCRSNFVFERKFVQIEESLVHGFEFISILIIGLGIRKS